MGLKQFFGCKSATAVSTAPTKTNTITCDPITTMTTTTTPNTDISIDKTAKTTSTTATTAETTATADSYPLSSSTSSNPSSSLSSSSSTPTIVIAGAGIVGLVLALALKKHSDDNNGNTDENIHVELYEQAKEFQDGVGAGLGLYPNGMRVIRDISPTLLKEIQQCGYPYLYRRWERHDGTEVAFANETVLGREDEENNKTTNGVDNYNNKEKRKEKDGIDDKNNSADDDNENDDDDSLSLQPFGIRRWKLQKILMEAVKKAGIPIYFSKRVVRIDDDSNNGDDSYNDEGEATTTSTARTKGGITLHFEDGTTKVADFVFAADGAKSPIRTAVAGHLTKLTYTGTTCLYGTASIARESRGICFPSSETTKCHGCFYPIGPNEQCFQFHMPTENPNSSQEGGWGALLENVGKTECTELANKLKADGWDDKYLQPLYHVEKAIKVPFALLNPHLPNFVFGRVVLVGDSAHPPVPYLGQGAQQGLEDAGTLALLVQEAVRAAKTAAAANSSENKSSVDTSQQQQDEKNQFSYMTTFLHHMDEMLQIYDQLRVPRTAEIVQNSKGMGEMQQKRAENVRYNEVKEELIKRDVFFYETMPTILPGVSYNYKKAVQQAIHEKKQQEKEATSSSSELLQSVPEESPLE